MAILIKFLVLMENFRNDGVEERYSVLIKLGNLTDADRFFSNLNGKKFSPSEVRELLFPSFI